MIGDIEFDAAMDESNAASMDDPIASMTDAGVEPEAVARLIGRMLPALMESTRSRDDAVASALAAGVELGVRAARIEAGDHDNPDLAWRDDG